MKKSKLSQNYKFPIGAVFAILAALALVMNILLYAVQRTAFSVFYFSLAGFSGLLNSGIYTVLYIAEYLVMLVALLALAIFLILKQRKMLLLATPIAIALSCILAICPYLLDFITLHNFSLQSLLSVFAYVMIAISCILLAVIIVVNSSNKATKLAFMPWIAPIPAILGYLILFTLSAANLPSIFSFAIRELTYSKYFLYSFSAILGSVRSVIFYAVFGILFALTLFFAARWITNPYKKSPQIKEAVTEQISE